MYLYFEDSRGNFRLVCDHCKEEDAGRRISEYVRSLNPDFKIYYMRSWKENGITTYDVGSHIELFYLLPAPKDKA